MKLRAAVIGLGVGEAHIAGYQGHPSCEVTHLCDFSPERLKLIGAKYPSAKLTAEADEILSNPEIDAVSIASYDSYHFNQALKAIESGKHVFIEKPLCLFRHEAEKLRAALDRNPDVRLGSNLILRTSPRFLKLKSMAESGAFGDIFHVEGDYLYGRLHKITDGWRGDEEFHSVVYGGAVHMIDLILWLSGVRVAEVSAVGNQIASQGSKFRYNDCVSAVLKFENGMTGKVSANYGCVIPHFHAFSVFGTQATFVNDFGPAKFYDSRDPQKKPLEITEDYPGVHKGGLLYDFVDSVLNDTKPLISQEEIFNTMAVCFAIEESCAAGQPVKVRYQFEESKNA